MSTKNVTLKEKVNGMLGDTIFPATTTPNVYDSAKSQALSQTLVNTPDYESLGFAKFSTATAYNAGEKVYKDNELYRFIADKTAGEWDVAKVEPWSIEQEIEEVDDAIRSLIPAQASADNKLADKAYVNDKVSTDTATFRGTFNLVTDLELTTEATQGQIATALGTAISGEDKNDYAFVQIPTSDATPTEIARIDRYKYTGLQWAFEYSLNNSGFTAEQWAAINSGITSSLVTAFGAKYDKPAGGIPKTDLAEGVQTSLGKADTALQQADGDERYLRLGSYSASTAVGLADNLRGQSVDSESYLIRPTGGQSNEVANGVASVLGMEGNSCVWNQMVAADTTEVATISGRKYMTVIGGVKSIVTGDGTAIAVTGGTDMVFDLSLMGIASLTTVAQVEAWLTQHPGLKPYYPYNAGTILSAQTLGIKTYGQNLLNPTTKQAKLIPYEWEENSNVYTIKNIPSGATATFTPDATGVAETVDISGGSLDITSYGSGILELSAATTDTYVCMKWDGTKDNDVVPYENHTYDFDVRNVYGKVSGAGEYVQCFPNGMRSAGSVHDTLTVSEAVDKINKLKLTSAWMSQNAWEYIAGHHSSVNVFFVDAFNASGYASDIKYNTRNVINPKFVTNFSANGYGTVDNMQVGSWGGSSDQQRLCFGSATFTKQNFIDALDGTDVYYERATPIVYTDLIYRDGGVDRPLADVLMNIEVNNWSIEEQLVTPYVDGNPTSIPATIKTQYGMAAVEAIDTLQKTCYFADDVHANLQALLTCINTNCAETLGGTFGISETATDKVFDFTFTPNVEPEP